MKSFLAPSKPNLDIQQASHLLLSAKHIVALTGAGISTPSGIPDFRSPGSGIWEHINPLTVASLTTFRHHPDQFFEWVRPLAQLIINANPNPAHVALARLEKNGYLAGVITQNIDNLHYLAGSEVVFEVHGHMREAVCVSCYRRQPTDDLITIFVQTGEIPHCPECDGILKPNVVLIEEQLPYDIFRQATELIDKSDLILIVGSSLEVVPVAHLPLDPINAGAHLIIINREPTYLDERADYIFRQDVASVLPCLVNEVLGEQE